MIKQGYEIFYDECHNIYQIRSGFEDVLEVEFSSETEKNIFNKIVEWSTGAHPENLDTITQKLCGLYEKAKVYDVIDQMKSYDLFEDDDFYESFPEVPRSQLSFWSMNTGSNSPATAKEVQQRIRDTSLAVFGSGIFSEMVAQKARQSGFEKITVEPLSSPNEKRLAEVVEKSDFFICDADSWNPHYMEQINEAAIKYNKPWILFMGAHYTKIFIGPLFIGKETGCYNCFINRIRSNMDYVPYFDEYVKHLKSQKKSSTGISAPVALYDMAASVCILETIQFVTEWDIPVLYKNMLAIDVTKLETTLHPFLKAPVCEVCTPDLAFNPAPWLEPVTLKTMRYEHQRPSIAQ